MNYEIAIVALVASSLAGCSGTLPRLAQPWTIEGRVVAETDGKPVVFKMVELERFESREVIFGGDFPFMSVRTDADGKFFISGIVSGSYALRSKCPSTFGGLFEPLGQLNSGQHVEREFAFHTCLEAVR